MKTSLEAAQRQLHQGQPHHWRPPLENAQIRPATPAATVQQQAQLPHDAKGADGSG